MPLGERPLDQRTTRPQLTATRQTTPRSSSWQGESCRQLGQAVRAPADTGIVVGDELLSVDGRPVSDLRLSDVRRGFNVEDAERELVLRRDTDTLRVVLKLRRLV